MAKEREVMERVKINGDFELEVTEEKFNAWLKRLANLGYLVQPNCNCSVKLNLLDKEHKVGCPYKIHNVRIR